jgi:hypothetical protein
VSGVAVNMACHGSLSRHTAALCAEPSATRLTVEALRSFLDSVEPERRAKVMSVLPLIGRYWRDTVSADLVWSDGGGERLLLLAGPPSGTSAFRSDRDPAWRLLPALQERAGPHSLPCRYDAEGQHFRAKCVVSYFADSRSIAGHRVRGRCPLRDPQLSFVDTAVDIHRTRSRTFLSGPGAWNNTCAKPSSNECLMFIDVLFRIGRDDEPQRRLLRSRPPTPLVNCGPRDLLRQVCSAGA